MARQQDVVVESSRSEKHRTTDTTEGVRKRRGAEPPASATLSPTFSPDLPAAEELVGRDAMTIFTGLWAQVLSLQIVKLYIVSQKPSGNRAENIMWLLLMGGACLLGAAVPHRSEATLLLCGLSIPVLLFTGSQSNHVFMEMAVCGAILLTFSRDRRKWQAQASHAVISFLIALYWITGLHKLNADWMEQRWSCCHHMTGGILALAPFQYLLNGIPTAAFAAAPYFAALTELGLPFVMLAKQPTSGATLRFVATWASVFHLPICVMLPPMSVYPFSLLMAPLYILVVPRQIVSMFGKVNPLFVLPVTALVGKWWTGFMAPELPAGVEPYEYPPYGCWAVGVVWCVVVYLALVGAAVLGKPGATPMLPTWRGRCLALGVLFFGLSPYLGIRNYPALAMFSNLRTEGGKGNHLFLGDDLDLIGWQRDYVTIHETNIKALHLAQVDLAPLYTETTQSTLATIASEGEFWLTPPLEAWTNNYTRIEWRPYSMPFMEFRRRLSPMAHSNVTGYVRYSRVVARANLRLPILWRWLGKPNPTADVVLRDNIVYDLATGGDLEIEEPLPWWQARLARWRTFDIHYSPCRH